MEGFCSDRACLYSGLFGLGVVGLCISFVLIYLCRALIVTRVTRLLDHPGFIFDYIHSIMGHRAGIVFATPGMYGTFL